MIYNLYDLKEIEKRIEKNIHQIYIIVRKKKKKNDNRRTQKFLKLEKKYNIELY